MHKEWNKRQANDTAKQPNGKTPICFSFHLCLSATQLMTYQEEDGLVPELWVRVETDGIEKLGNYIKLSEELEREAVHEEEEDSSPSSSSCGRKRSLWFWIKLALLLAFLPALALAAYKWLVPLIMDKV